MKKATAPQILLPATLLLIVGAFLFVSGGTNIIKFGPSPSSVSEQFETTKVTKVFDGDTIEVEGGQSVRYIGIDSPEIYPQKGCFSEEAKKANEDLVMGKEVKLVRDVNDVDKYNRLLRYVYVGTLFVNDELVRQGFAKAYTVYPDTSFKETFVDSEKHAQLQNLGLWGKCR